MIMGVLAFWLFAQTTLNIAPDMQEDLGLTSSLMNTAVAITALFSINIDARLIAARDGEVVALSNGCVCCALGPDLGDSLARVAARDPAPERIVVEASGVSDPWRIAQLVKLEPGVALDAVLVLVDAAGFLDQLADPWLTDTLQRQLARADLIVLSKCNLADAATRAAVRRIRPDVPVLKIADGALPAALLDGPGAGRPHSRFIAEPPEHGFRTWHWDAACNLDEARLRALMAELPDSVLRLKGICRLGAAGEPYLLQRVGRRWSLTRWTGAATEPGLVLIGTDRLPPDATLAGLFARTVMA